YLAEVTQKTADEKRDIFLSVTKRRHGDAHNVQAKEKVVPKFPLAHERLEILVCRRNQPHVRAQRLIAADALEGALLADHAQQFHLRARIDFGHFIEKNRAAVCLFKSADADRKSTRLNSSHLVISYA